jgi:hypothetical protein
MMRKRTLITAAVVVLAAVLWIRHDRQNIRVEIDRERVAYIVAYCRGLGPRQLEHREHPEMIDGLVDMLNGEYAYRKTVNNYGSSGGGPYSVLFYGADGQLIADIRYFDGLIAVPKNQRGKYRLYEKVDGRLSFQEFEAYLNTYGRNR